MTERLRVLFVEGSDVNFKSVVRALQREVPHGEFLRVESADTMRSALAEASWDAVISDWSLPNFSALAAIHVLKEMDIDIPFIVVSGVAGEEAAVQAMRAGAHDYIRKDNLAHVFTALDRELCASRVRHARRKVDRDLVERTAKLASTNADLERTRDSLRQALHVRDEFLSVASHELRTPLTSLKLQVQSLIRHRKSSPTIADQLKKIDRQADRLTELVTQLLDVSRITGNRLQLETEDMDLAKLVQEVTARFVLDLRHCGSSLQMTTTGSTRGQWDRERMDQVITNLISNAIKFGDGNPIEVSVQAKGPDVRLSVRDHGIGIEPKNQARIFERFERAVSIRHFGGLGLGLWIVRQIVEASGGTLAVRSEVGRGSTFWVVLPALVATTAQVASTVSDAVVLFIDDDADIRDAMKMVLEEEGYSVVSSASGDEAFEYLRGHPEPCLILLDLMMPQMDGYEFRRRQLADPAFSRIPVVVATGAGAASVRGSELAAAAILTKPVEVEALLTAVEAHRSHHHA